MIWEYNYMLSTQLEEQQRYYEDKIKSIKLKHQNSPTYKKNQERIDFLDQEQETLENKIDSYDKETKMFNKKIKMTTDKIESLKKDIEQLKAFNTAAKANLKAVDLSKVNSVALIKFLKAYKLNSFKEIYILLKKTIKYMHSPFLLLQSQKITKLMRFYFFLQQKCTLYLEIWSFVYALPTKIVLKS